jgi:hypothetical protein
MSHRKTEGAMQTGFRGDSGPREIAVGDDVRYPYGMAAGPDAARQPDPALQRKLSRHRFELGDVSIFPVPELDASDGIALDVNFPHSSRLPAENTAHGLEDFW